MQTSFINIENIRNDFPILKRKVHKDKPLVYLDDWIKLAKSLGMNQIDFHGGSSFRFGDCRPNPETYPEGFESLKAVIDKLHAAGIAAGLHTYAFFIDKNCPWVTPVPDPRLAKDATFTLAADLAAEAAAVPVVESTGGHVDHHRLLRAQQRHAADRRRADHLHRRDASSRPSRSPAASAAPAARSRRPTPRARRCITSRNASACSCPTPTRRCSTEVAAQTAEMFNECGFDMIYLDALDGEDILGGAENGWHYGSQFVFEICKRLKKPALMEMSTFHHHLWCVRSRYWALGPSQPEPQEVHRHPLARRTTESRRMFLPGELGWWALKTWTGPPGRADLRRRHRVPDGASAWRPTRASR